MTRLDTIWRLPGPRSFTTEVLDIARRQHVTVVLPAYLRQHRDVTDALAAELAESGNDARRIHPWTGNGNLTEAIGVEIDGYDPPVTVPDLLTSSVGVTKTYVLDATDLDPAHREDLPNLIRRVELESRTVARADRCTFVWILGSEDLPLFNGGDRSGVAVGTAWYWSRAARWDVTAHMAVDDETARSTVASEIRLETILQIARWDFAVAELLMAEWDGDPSALAVLRPDVELDRTVRWTKPTGSRPPDSLLAAWNCGVVECWHGVVEWSPTLEIEDSAFTKRLIWSAQARVLLPWIEVRRDRLDSRLRDLFGLERYQQLLKEFNRDQDHLEDIVEVGRLFAITKARVGNADRQLTEAAKRLWLARNQLAHLRPMAQDAVDELVRSCGEL